MRQRGYALALDDFTLQTGADALLPFARYVKVDVLSTDAAERRSIDDVKYHATKLRKMCSTCHDAHANWD